MTSVELRDASGRTSLHQLAKNERPDPRMFYFPNGAPGVLIEKTGEFFRLITEVHPQAPDPRPIARDRFFTSNGVRLHYVEQGSGDAVILLHELDGSVSSFMRSGIFQGSRDARIT